MTSGPPKFYFKMRSKFPNVFDAYEDLSNIVQEQGPIEPNYRYLLKLAFAIGMDHESSIKIQVKKALEFGATQEEIIHVILLSITQVGFARMMASLAIADKVFESF